MTITVSSLQLLAQEARALLTRLDSVKPFALHETMVPAATPSMAALTAIESYLAHGRATLRQMIARYCRWLNGIEHSPADVTEAQRKFTFLKLRYNTVLSQFDIFADAMTQRSEHDTGVWLAGLDVVAADVLALPGDYYSPLPVLCYLDRGHGAAIRRARTRLPGGGRNPCAIIRIPRERMVGSGVGSSLAHEVGHQGAALLDLVESVRPLLRDLQLTSGQPDVWRWYERWLGEVMADLWSVARVGVASTLGLMAVVSLPRAFVFRVSPDDPHPIPWLRVKLSCALGQRFYPDAQWRRIERIWDSYYPLAGLDTQRHQLITTLETAIPQFADLLVTHRPVSLRGATVIEAMGTAERQPNRLRGHYEAWLAATGDMRRAPPSLAFAVIGQARADDTLSPEAESRVLTELLTYWALSSALNRTVVRPVVERARRIAIAN